jgi:hypothetical protein
MRRNFALISDNKVINICCVDKETIEESLSFLNTYFNNTNGIWMFYDHTQKKHKFCAVNANYNSDGDYFFEDKPLNSWIYNTVLYRWEPPVPYPDGQWNELNRGKNNYVWNEDSLNWVSKT